MAGDTVDIGAGAAEGTIRALTVNNPLREATIRSAIQALQFPEGSHGLDAGCGLGLQARLLAEAVGPAGHITGLDLSPEFLAYAERIVEKAGLSERISFKEGNVTGLPFDDDAFDWAWSMDCVGYIPLEPVALLRELARVVKPGGRVAILAWSSESLLPGYPRLEARLRATTAGIAPFAEGRNPQSHFLRALGWFSQAGLENASAQTFAGGAYAPLTDELRRALEDLFRMRWPGVKDELDPEDWATFRRLCLPESAEYILNQPDYYAFFTYSMFSGLASK
jgi:demethylmenaquinone methyltransferase/2-methoxy-6-polyprenyl-1,4-benzoquinol methylase